MAIGHKSYEIVPRWVAQRIGKLSKIGALELAYSLASRLAPSADDAEAVYEVLRAEWEIVAGYRDDRPLPSKVEDVPRCGYHGCTRDAGHAGQHFLG